MNLYVTQVKRELWENKVSFIYTPTIISILILLIAIFAAVYVKDSVNKNSNFHFSMGSSSDNTAAVSNDETPKITSADTAGHKEKKPIDITASIAKDPGAFNKMITGVVYVNSVLLYLVFSIVMSAYALGCLFDDRKNKDILFWRSMPVSETTNVLVKLGMVLLIGPLVILVLNVAVTLLIFLFGLVFFGLEGIKLSDLIFSAFGADSAFYIPMGIFYKLFFSLCMLMPVVGFAFLASAFSKKTPFIMFVSPAILALIDKIVNSVFGIGIGVIDIFVAYGRMLINVKSVFMFNESFTLSLPMILPLFICVGIGGIFVAGSIWLRNNRYEI